MYRIVGTTIKINRGDKLLFGFSIPIKTEPTADEEKTKEVEEPKYYEFKVGDVLTFGVYKRKAMSEKALLLKDFKVEKDGTTEIVMEFDPEEMKIGDLINKPTQYWYEIQLNREQTVLGYDDITGAKILELYPEGSDIPLKNEIEVVE